MSRTFQVTQYYAMVVSATAPPTFATHPLCPLPYPLQVGLLVLISILTLTVRKSFHMPDIESVFVARYPAVQGLHAMTACDNIA